MGQAAKFSRTQSPFSAICQSNSPSAQEVCNLEKEVLLAKLQRQLEQLRAQGLIELNEQQWNEVLKIVEAYWSLPAESWLAEARCRMGCHGSPARMPYPLSLAVSGKTDAGQDFLNRLVGVIQAGSSVLLIVPSATLIAATPVYPPAGVAGVGLAYLTVDNWNAGWNKILSGEDAETWTQRGAAHLAGYVFDSQTAQWVGVGVDVVANLGGGIFTVRQAGNLAIIRASSEKLLFTPDDINILLKSKELKKQPIVLELFAGEKEIVPGAINIDRIAEEGIKINFVESKLSFVPSNSVDEIITFNPFIKDLPITDKNMFFFLEDAARTVKPRGQIVVTGQPANAFVRKLPSEQQLEQLGLKIIVKGKFNLLDDIAKLV
jgi:hypothetical protein